MGVYNYTMAQEAYIGKPQYFGTEVVLEMGASRKCRIVPLNPGLQFSMLKETAVEVSGIAKATHSWSSGAWEDHELVVRLFIYQ